MRISLSIANCFANCYQNDGKKGNVWSFIHNESSKKPSFRSVFCFHFLCYIFCFIFMKAIIHSAAAVVTFVQYSLECTLYWIPLKTTHEKNLICILWNSKCYIRNVISSFFSSLYNIYCTLVKCTSDQSFCK